MVDNASTKIVFFYIITVAVIVLSALWVIESESIDMISFFHKVLAEMSSTDIVTKCDHICAVVFCCLSSSMTLKLTNVQTNRDTQTII